VSSALLGIGSNIQPKDNLKFASDVLRYEFESVLFSPVYQSKAVGMQGDDFLNACCLIHGDFNLQYLNQWCKRQEDVRLRDRAQGSWRPRTLDLDILMFDNQLIDDELYIFAHAFVPASTLVVLENKDIDISVVTKVELIL